jgi:hypothetical protein
MEVDPVFGEKCREVPNSKDGDRTLLELRPSGLKYWLSGTAEEMIVKGGFKPKRGVDDRIRRKQGPRFKELYMVVADDLEP